ncbi:MAG TPA: ATP-binding protein, partial [Candidatus Eisenbacteria bacterium]|nr:ATP-binding protein [Candidatus Eisenbacteria bacterium]
AIERVTDGEALARARSALDDARHAQAREQRLATLGEHTARFAREARHPLASIAAFARRVHRALPEDHPDRESLEIVVREAERLERMVVEPLEAANPGPPRLKVENLNTLVQEAITRRGEALVRRRVRLLKRLSGDMPALLLDPERLRRAIEALVDHALDRVGVGGRVRIETRRSGTTALFELAHDAEGEPGDLIEQLFVPFASATQPVPTLGLSIAHQIVREHGGELRVRREGEWGAILSLALPIATNDDRRHGADRRRPRPDRRAARVR